MLCDICGKNEATFHYSEVINGKKTEHHLCGECAARTDISYYSSFFDNDGRLGQLLSGLLGTPLFGGESDDPKTHVVCPNCKMSYGDFIKNSAFGCAECYNVFGPLLEDSIRKVQGSTSHQGKHPAGLYGTEPEENVAVRKEYGKPEEENAAAEQNPVQLKKEEDMLAKRLKLAVTQEDFEEAARLRDRIREIREQIERLNADA